MKTAFRTILPVLALLFLLVGCVRDNPTLDSPSPTAKELSVAIVSPAQGGPVDGNVVEVGVEAKGIEITEADGDTSGETGHFHIFIDQDPVATGETISDDPGIVHFSESPVRIPGLGVGKHKLTAVLGDGTHVRVGRTSDSVEVEVKGPSIDAMAPEDAPMATGFALSIAPTGVQIVAAEEDPGAGGTGHVDLIIDPGEDPEPNGQPIPADPTHAHLPGTTHQVTGLTAGEHTIWAVLSDKNHVPVSPMVADKVVVTIR